MGAWGCGNFENDAAMDWLSGLDTPALLFETIERIANASDDAYLDVDCCCAALAAAEVVAACCGHRSETLPKAAIEWVGAHPDARDARTATRAVQAVTRIERSSELQELFDERGPNVEWRSVIADLRRRLVGCE